MTDNELLLAISDLMDKKVKSELRSELQEALQPIKEDIQDIRGDIQDIRGDIQDIRGDIQDIKHRVTKLELHQENVTDKNIALLVENYVPASRKFLQEAEKIESMQADIEVMKRVLREHSEKLQKIS